MTTFDQDTRDAMTFLQANFPIALRDSTQKLIAEIMVTYANQRELKLRSELETLKAEWSKQRFLPGD